MRRGSSHGAELAPIWMVATVLFAFFIIRETFTVANHRGIALFDDAMISMRYARNLVETGHFVWNVGDAPVEGYTNFLWTLVMAAVHLLPLPDRWICLPIVLFGAVLLLVTGRQVLALMRIGDGSRCGTVAALASVLMCYALVFWTLRGMEVGLLACLITIGLVRLARMTERADRRDLVVVAVCAALAMLTRTDAVVIVIAWCGWCAIVLHGRQRLVVICVLVGVVVLTLGGHTAWRVAYYGDPLPNTYYLKLGGIALGTRLVRGIDATLHILQQGWMVPVLLAVFAFVDAKRRPPALLLALTVAAAGAYSIYVGGDAWEEFEMPNRYVAPTVPALLVLATFGLEEVSRSRGRVRAFVLMLLGVAAMQLVTPYSRVGLHLSPFPVESHARLRLVFALGFAVALTWSPRGSVPLLGALVLLATTGERWVVFAHEGAAHTAIDAGRVRHGLAIRAATSPEATIAVTPAGSIPYFAHRHTIDLLGKSDVHVAHMSPRTSRFHPGHVKWDYPYSIGQLQPDLIDEIFTPPQANLVEADRRALPGWGYVEIAPNVYVRRGTQYVDVARLVRELRRP